MVTAQESKVLLIKTVPATNTTIASATDVFEIDRKGFDYVSVDIIYGPADGTVAQYAGTKLVQSDTVLTYDTLATAYNTTANIVVPFVGAATGVAGASFTLPTMHATNLKLVRFEVDCRPLARYLYVGLLSPDANNDRVTVLAKGWRGHISPCPNATTEGVDVLVRG